MTFEYEIQGTHPTASRDASVDAQNALFSFMIDLCVPRMGIPVGVCGRRSKMEGMSRVGYE